MNFYFLSYLETTAVNILATDPVYSLTILSKYLSIEAITMPPVEVNNTATTNSPRICSFKPKIEKKLVGTVVIL